ncbi:Uncharacterised protein [Mycobacterium tuberculosis]|uniref:Uncharacterized protein n=2 Tax=Mycobacterium tuberculosis TaxID=1773 RepID=A0A655AL36_MYCTX|nr:Uncharacterised protein [Mycobacterium tuberculosis]CKR54148.1 Uncharacterised protein [Mycobacterium tuberculosis]CKT26621.1 Uncharacterised protein [Mycobacterium tuberculosis]CKT38243.1 Uncharacterised protein [Mycobacterium tuberculosis]CKT42989.1 Uncharacterised protein [Mycobacterium tuberculosis]
MVVDPAVFGQRGGVGADVRRNLHELVEIGGQIGIAEAENDVGPVKNALMVRLGNPHHVTDNLQRQWTCEFADQIGLPVGIIGDHR